jgi:phospholipase D1/2
VFTFRAASYLERIQEKAGITFHQTQVALARQWLGDTGPAKVTIKSPEVSKEGVVITEKTPVKEEAIEVPATEEEARQIIARYERAAEAVRGDEDVADNVVQHMLEDKTDLLQEKWLGDEQEELNA